MGNCVAYDPIAAEIPRDDEPLNISIFHRIKVPIIFLIGGPGVGKTYIGRRLALEHGFTIIITSDLMRLEVDADTYRGRLFKRIMLEGRNLPADVVVKMILRKMLLYVGTPGYLIVGFPRDRAQANLFNRKVKSPDLLIYLWARRELLEQRMRGRAIANKRFDDTDEAINVRIQTFYDSTIRAINLYKTSITVVDAQQSYGAILQSCSIAINRRMQQCEIQYM